MADLMSRYAADVRLGRSAISLVTLQGLVDEAAADLGLKSANTLAALDTDLTLAVSRLSAGLNAVLDSDQVVKSAITFHPAEEMKASLTVQLRIRRHGPSASLRLRRVPPIISTLSTAPTRSARICVIYVARCVCASRRCKSPRSRSSSWIDEWRQSRSR